MAELNTKSREQLDSIVQKMIKDGRTGSEIKLIISDFKKNHANDSSLSETSQTPSPETGMPGFGGGISSQEADMQSQNTYSPTVPYQSGGGGFAQGSGLAGLANVPSSTWNLIKNVGSTAKNFLQYGNPIATTLNIGQDKNPVTQIGKIVGGAGVQVGKAIGVVPKETQTPEFEQFVNFVGSRYGSVENFKRTVTNDPVGVFADILAFTGTGASVAGKGAEFADVAGNVANKVKSLPGKIPGAIGSGVKGIPGATGLADVINPAGAIDAGTQTILRETPVSMFDKYTKITTDAISDPRLPTALDAVGQVGADVAGQLKSKLAEIGQAKNQLVKQIASVDLTPQVVDTLNAFKQAVNERLGATFNKAGELIDLKGRISKLDATDKAIVKEIYTKLGEFSKNPTFQAGNDTVDALQGILFKAKNNMLMPVNSNVTALGKNIVKNLNEAIKNVAESELGNASYAELNSQYAKIKNTFDSLNKGLGKDVKNGAALMKRVFSPSDAGTKKLFNDIKEITGIDLTQEATIAKFVMEQLGDTRQKSLIQSITNLTPAGILLKGAQWAVKGLQDPIKRARDILIKTPK